MSIKLFATDLFSLQFFDLFQALSKQLTGTEFISRFPVQSSSSQLSFEFTNRNSVNFEPWEQSILFSILLNEWWIYIVVEYITDILLLIQTSFQVLNQRLCMK